MDIVQQCLEARKFVFDESRIDLFFGALRDDQIRTFIASGSKELERRESMLRAPRT